MLFCVFERKNLLILVLFRRCFPRSPKLSVRPVQFGSATGVGLKNFFQPFNEGRGQGRFDFLKKKRLKMSFLPEMVPFFDAWNIPLHKEGGTRTSQNKC